MSKAKLYSQGSLRLKNRQLKITNPRPKLSNTSIWKSLTYFVTINHL